MPADDLLPHALLRQPDRLAVVDPDGSWSYAAVAAGAAGLAAELLPGRDADLAGRRVALLCRPGHDYLAALFACWWRGAVAVPLHPGHPDAEQEHVLSDAGAEAVLASPDLLGAAERLAGGERVVVPVERGGATGGTAGPAVPPDPDRPALMVHTSGTTGRPKGVVHTHGSLAAQVAALVEAWAWRPDDRILLVLPLNHVHGIVNVVLCAAAAGAACEAPGRFDAVATWDRLASGELTLFMAVPTVYARLIAAWEAAGEADRERWSEGSRLLRLMVSGSAALPVSTLDRWERITGHVLLERYGMTELGMALSNRLDRRVPGHVGEPLPGVEVRVVDETGQPVAEGQPGELLVRGPSLFREYWQRPADTAAAFTSDGWFRTGDVAVHEPEGFRLLGRSSVDIIKSGGEKVSALEIEEVYRTHAAVADCAVVGVPDPVWGEAVCAAVVPAAGAPTEATAEELRAWGKQRLAPAKVPVRFLLVDELPRNPLGKVVKPRVTELFGG